MVKRFMKLLTYIKNRAEVYGCFEELAVDPMAVRACTPGWHITVTARIPHKGITMEMKAEVVLGQQLAVQADRFLETIDESLNVRRYLSLVWMHTLHE
jgi:hypothetical protein